jgi:hypothetical protein
MDIKTKIKKAKIYAKKDYENNMKKAHAFNPGFKRKWIKVESEGGYFIALSGSPGKCFVSVEKSGKVCAINGTGEILKVFK